MAKIVITSNTEKNKVSIKVSKKLKKELKKVKENVLNVDNLTKKAFDMNVSIVALSFVSELNKRNDSNIKNNIYSSINKNNEYEIHLELTGGKKELKEILKFTSDFIYETLNGNGNKNCDDEHGCCDSEEREDCDDEYEDYDSEEDEDCNAENESCNSACQAEEQKELFNSKKDFILQTIAQALDSVSVKELNEKGSIVISFN